jgi:hypothetical protein
MYTCYMRKMSVAAVIQLLICTIMVTPVVFLSGHRLVALIAASEASISSKKQAFNSGNSGH